MGIKELGKDKKTKKQEENKRKFLQIMKETEKLRREAKYLPK